MQSAALVDCAGRRRAHLEGPRRRARAARRNARAAVVGAVLDDAITLLPENTAETAGRRAVALALAVGPNANQPGTEL